MMRPNSPMGTVSAYTDIWYTHTRYMYDAYTVHAYTVYVKNNSESRGFSYDYGIVSLHSSSYPPCTPHHTLLALLVIPSLHSLSYPPCTPHHTLLALLIIPSLHSSSYPPCTPLLAPCSMWLRPPESSCHSFGICGFLSPGLGPPFPPRPPRLPHLARPARPSD